jgi:superfamily II RNA helicase
MVKICDTFYKNTKYENIFNKYPFELDHFQKYAIEAIEENKNILITSHTGSGKTLPAEYAIQKFCNLGKKVIYTSPIKSLSNQKFYEFNNKFQDIEFGILTGDIKFNPQAQCLIMTTEILRNTLFQKELLKNNTEIKSNEKKNIENTLHFDIDIENELACVIFDEVHYINDENRGKIWEETIIQLPDNVVNVMLSATIDKTEQFASWIESIKKKEVWIASTLNRVVPLIHYNYFVINKHILKKTKDKNIEIKMNNIDDKFLILKDKDFNNDNILNLKKIKYYMNLNKLYTNNKHILNCVVEKLNNENMLPAICFVFSRKKCENYAYEIEKCLFNEDIHIMNVIEKECKSILTKLPNYKEYFQLPEFNNLVYLLKKGIAFHHSGVMPVLREMIELLFSKGYIKLLFATETFSVGINMPTKTVLFTSLKKFDGNNQRYLLPHEYTQMAGRAGRRGLDTLGHVIHLNNMFPIPELIDYKNILKGNPQTLTSKFHIYPNLLLKSIANDTNKEKLQIFSEKSFDNKNILSLYHLIKGNLENEQNKLHNYLELTKNIDIDKLEDYKQLKNQCDICKPKKKKTLKNKMNEIKLNYRNFDNDYKIFNNIQNIKYKVEKLSKEKEFYENFYIYKINNYLNYLKKYDYIDEQNNVTLKGLISSQIQEVNGLLFGDLIIHNHLDTLNDYELVMLFSWFTNIKMNDIDYNDNIIELENELKELYNKIKYKLNIFYNEEIELGIVDDSQFVVDYNLSDIMREWCFTENEEQCKKVLFQLKEKEIFAGEFIKSILKINNICQELINVCDIIGNIKLKNNLSKIPELTLKYIATNQSLYI